MKFTIWAVAFLLAGNYLFAQSVRPDRNYKPVKAQSYVQAKNYYLLTLLEMLPEVKEMIKTDPVLSKVAMEKRGRMASAVKNCKQELGCYINAVKFSEEEIAEVGARFRNLYANGKGFNNLVGQHLLPSGYYQLYAGLAPPDMLISAWEQDARAINYSIDIYGSGKKPAYAQIDSIGFNINDPAYPEMIALNESLALSETQGDFLFYSAPLVFTLHCLEINDRDRAADFEPMQGGINKSALTYAHTIAWSKYKYTLILVPGEGPEEAGTVISGGGMLRCRLAALQYHHGLAPFIMVSGGCVHPFKTKYNEAEEMKKYLMQTLHIPEHAILMEPHARHTTTNLRNCARLIFKYGFPMDKPCITSTARGQSSYITGVMTDRCRKELGYVPYKNGRRLSDNEAEFYPLANSMQIDYDEPMDP